MSAPFRGLRDAHLHLAEHGEALSCADLSSCTSREDALERVAAAAQRTPDAQWIKAIRARVNGWREPTWPSARELHDAAGGRPCVMRSFDHHALVASSAVLEAASISAHTPDPEGGVIDRRDGAPTGLLLERACNLVWAVMPEPSLDERREHLRLALADLARHGFVEAHDMLSPAWMGPLLAELAATGDAGANAVRVWLYPKLEEAEAILEDAEAWSRDTVRLAGAKIFLDGTLNSRTAWMLEPYPNPVAGHPRGVSLYDPAALDAALSRCDILGLPAAIHAIGDGAVRAALDSIERVSPTALGFRIEHCQFVDEADIPRFAALGVVASLQPCHLLADIEALRTITPHRAHRAFPLRDLIDSVRAAGYTPEELVWLGSDTPVVSPDPLDNLQAAVERRRTGAPRDQAVAPEQAITRDEALACMASPDAAEVPEGVFE